MAVDLFRDLLVKITNIYPDDLYIRHNRVVIPGPDSDAKNNGAFICVLNEDIRKVYDEHLGEEANTYIKSIRDAKKKFESGLGDYKSEFDENWAKQYDTLLDIGIKTSDWRPITDIFSTDELTTIFDNGLGVIMFEGSEFPSFMFGKDLVPMVKTTNANMLFFSDPVREMFSEGLESAEKMWRITFKFSHPYFDAYYFYRILELEEEKE